MSHEENSILFSLSHLTSMAAATRANAAPALSIQRAATLPADSLFDVAPLAVAPMPVLLPSRTESERPSWLLPVIIGLGSLFVIVVVLGIAVAVRQPDVQQVPVAQLATPPAPTPPASPAAVPPAEQKAAAPALGPSAVEASAAVGAGDGAKRKLAKGKRHRKARIARRRAARGRMVATAAPVAAPAPKRAKRARKPDALDALIDSAMKQ